MEQWEIELLNFQIVKAALNFEPKKVAKLIAIKQLTEEFLKEKEESEVIDSFK